MILRRGCILEESTGVRQKLCILGSWDQTYTSDYREFGRRVSPATLERGGRSLIHRAFQIGREMYLLESLSTESVLLHGPEDLPSASTL